MKESREAGAFQGRATLALARATLRGYAESPAAAAALFAFYALLGWFFAIPLFASGQASLAPLLEFAPLLQTALVAALTMSLLAEELRSGTFETLASFPLHDWDIVLGKYLGFAAFHACATAALLVLAVSVRALAAPPAGLDWGEALGVLGALWLHGLALGALGLLASSLGRSLIASFTLAFAAGFALLAAGKLAAYAPGPVARVLEWASLDSHLEALSHGVLDTRDLAYFAAFVFVCLYLAAARLELRRARWGAGLAFTGGGAALALAAAAALNAGAAIAWTRLDFSEGRAYSLSRATEDVLSRLKSPVQIRAFLTRGLPPPDSLTERYLRDLLSEYRAAGRGKVAVEFVDPDDSDAARRDAKAAGVVPVTLRVYSRGEFRAREAYMGVALEHAGRRETLPAAGAPRDLEYELTRRIKRLAEPRKTVVGFLAGHGERDPGDASVAPFFAAVREHMSLSAASLDKPFPEGMEALWILGPREKLAPKELDRLREWVAAGKPLGLLLNLKSIDYEKMLARPRDPGLEPLLAEWGVRVSSELVVDAQADRIEVQSRVGAYVAARVLDYPYVPVSTRLNRAHPAVRGLSAVPFPFVHALSLDAPPPGVSLTPLAESSPRSWLRGSSEIAPGLELESIASGRQGPFALAAALEGPLPGPGGAPGKPARVVIVATAHQVDPRFANRRASFEFLFNALEWSYQDEALLSIRAKGPAYRPLRPIPEAGARALLRLALASALPLAAVGFALAARAGRDKRRREKARLYGALAEKAAV